MNSKKGSVTNCENKTVCKISTSALMHISLSKITSFLGCQFIDVWDKVLCWGNSLNSVTVSSTKMIPVRFGYVLSNTQNIGGV